MNIPIRLLLLTTLTAWLAIPAPGFGSGSQTGDQSNGQAIYHLHCEACHGENGRGDGPRAPFLAPKPGNFVSAATSAKSDEELLEIIANGTPRTSMKGWVETFTEQERRNVLAYIRSFVRFQPRSLTPPPPGSPQ